MSGSYTKGLSKQFNTIIRCGSDVDILSENSAKNSCHA